jgi:hypothetical protein
LLPPSDGADQHEPPTWRYVSRLGVSNGHEIDGTVKRVRDDNRSTPVDREMRETRMLVALTIDTLNRKGSMLVSVESMRSS